MALQETQQVLGVITNSVDYVKGVALKGNALMLAAGLVMLGASLAWNVGIRAIKGGKNG